MNEEALVRVENQLGRYRSGHTGTANQIRIPRQGGHLRVFGLDAFVGLHRSIIIAIGSVISGVEQGDKVIVYIGGNRIGCVY